MRKLRNKASVCRDLGISNLSCNRRFKQEKNVLAEGIERKGKGNREKRGKKKRQSLCTGVSKLTQGDRFLQSRRFINQPTLSEFGSHTFNSQV
ncbi:MAG: hypothetical protein DRR16_15265 [Candidatus Parabeggiatoa sp. nov. 3]|nr:MAG: hypothetical protein DRR00_12730 [Gammaproteobacteria bacterium]RKZ65984.1 MAG: hypothetical protein DRQ99_11070 [Gammaproteobacteria bacterium]RKZ84222.1 MAG: hypothetical protein DRR16_15265 [Gammaproteobacteria bacterium]